MTFENPYTPEKLAEIRRLVCVRHEALLRQLDLWRPDHSTPEGDKAYNERIAADEALRKLGIYF